MPDDACVTSDVEIGAGAADVLDRDNDGVDVAYDERESPTGGPEDLHMDANIGVGGLEVVRDGSLPDPGATATASRSSTRAGTRSRPDRCAEPADQTSPRRRAGDQRAGIIVLLDRVDVIDLDLGYGLPLVMAVVGAILLTAGLEGPRERD